MKIPAMVHMQRGENGATPLRMMENGVIAEAGTFSSLMERNGKYAQLVRKQIVI